MHVGIPPEKQNPDIASLATLGMRIRKAVSDGYTLTANVSLSYDSQYFNRSTKQSIERVALPTGMSAPPALTAGGSTFQSGLNVSEWGAPSMKLSSLPFASGTKRRHEDDLQHENAFVQPPTVQFPTHEKFCAGNGKFSFNQDF